MSTSTARETLSNVAPVMALSIRQPWAELILAGTKDIENRVWRSAFRGRLLIHTSSNVDEKAMLGLRLDPGALPRGGIVGEVEVVDCVTDHPSPWFHGPYGLVLRNPRRLPFIPMAGRQKIFRVEVPFLGPVT
jgi:hypothetical protein